MPNRMLREGIRSSEAVNALSDRAFRLYANLLVSADDFGLCEWGAAWIKANCLPLVAWSLKEIGPLMHEIAKERLVRCYELDAKTYAAVERWNQRRFANKPKFPMPPWGDEHVLGGYVDPRARPKDDEPAPTPKPPRINGHAIADFEAFWSVYPRKQARGSAEATWKRIKPDEALLGVMLACVERAKKSSAWTKDSGQYIPQPATWLNQKRWLDEQSEPREPDFPI